MLDGENAEELVCDAGQEGDKTQKERRAFARIQVDIAAAVYRHGRVIPVRIKNLSQGGMMVIDAFDLFEGDQVSLKTLRGRELSGLVTWSMGRQIGVAFNELLQKDDPLFADKI